jgi:hypothetical protein
MNLKDQTNIRILPSTMGDFQQVWRINQTNGDPT